MRAYIIRDGVFTMTHGQVGSNLLHYDAFGKRYLTTYSEITIVGRLFPEEDPTARPVEGPRVSFYPLPGYHGPLGFLRNLPKIAFRLVPTIRPDCSYILRLPATLPSIYGFLLYIRSIPFGVEVVGDPADAYSAAVLGNRALSFIFQRMFVRLLKWQCKHAAATAYVTACALQKKYPGYSAETMFSFTSIDLTPDAYVAEGKASHSEQTTHLIITGNMQKNLKGHDTLLLAIARLLARHVPVDLTIIGFGEHLTYFKKMAQELGIDKHVHFTGKVQAGQSIRNLLDQADLFVLPSRQEGLPRALLEAMARGLPAIASDVGGTGELLDECALIEPNDVTGLTERILYFIRTPGLMQAQAKRNLQVARQYSEEKVRVERKKFYDALAAAVYVSTGTSRQRNTK